jgi:hypothetical protein
MVQVQAIAGASPWTNPELLADLLDYLREHGFKVTTDDYAVAQDLVLALITRGEDVTDLSRLKMRLAPLLCSNPREQDTFSGYFDRWHAQAIGKGSQPMPVPDIETELEKTGNRWENWKWIVSAIAAVLAMGLIFLFATWGRVQPIHQPHKNDNGTEETKTEAAVHTAELAAKRPLVTGVGVLYLFLAVLLAVIGMRIWWHFSARLFLRRRSVSAEPNLISIVLDLKSQEWLDIAFLRQTARELRRRYPVISSDLAMAATVEQTILHQGQFTAVYASRLVSPEYLVLIDRKSFRDHNARYLDELIAYLQSDHVQLTRYYFDQKPRMLYSAALHEMPVALRDLHALYRDARVLIFADCAAFFNEISGEVESWTESLWCWPDLAVLTPVPKDAWGYYERSLASYASVLPANASSVLTFARYINHVRMPAGSADPDSTPFPYALASRSNRWLERDAPSAESVEDLFLSVRRFLGEEGFLWLSACAAYPEIHFNLTLYLGSNLHDADGHPLFTNERAAALFRLPWMQRAYMPDWVRLHLLKQISEEQRRQVQELFNRLWLSVATDSSKAINLEIARQHPRTLAAMAHSAFEKFRKKAASDSPLRDYVFASMMLGKSFDPLAVRLPKFWRSVLQNAGDNLSEGKQNPAIDKWLGRVAMGGTFFAALGGVIGYGFSESASFVGGAVLLQVLFWLLALVGGLVRLNRRLLLFVLAILNAGLLDIFLGIALYGPQKSDALFFFALELPHILVPLGILLFVSPHQILRQPTPWNQRSVRRIFWAGSLATPVLIVAAFIIYFLTLKTSLGEVFALLSIGVFLFIHYLVGFVESWFALKIGSRPMYGQGLWTSIGWLPTIIGYYFLFAVAGMAGASWLGLVLGTVIWLAVLVLIPRLVRKSLSKGPDVPAVPPVQMKKAAAA